jgi:hypothetical protein
MGGITSTPGAGGIGGVGGIEAVLTEVPVLDVAEVLLVLTGKSVTISPLTTTFACRLKEASAGSSSVTSPELVRKS